MGEMNGNAPSVATTPPQRVEPTLPGALPYDPTRTQQVRKGPALVFLGIVALVIVSAILVAVIEAPSPPTTPVLGTPKGSSIAAVAASSMIAKITQGGQPPSDITNALVVPEGASVTRTAAPDRGVDQYDASVTFAVSDAPKAVTAFYLAELKLNKWKVAAVDATADGKGTEIFATRASSDGYYWEVGVVVEPANPSITPALAGDAATASSSVELRIFEVADEG